ncbi:MAG TPA: diaminopimelate epimerase [Acidobacteriaceae bacterium]|nr:diaminopimelate epimerase [Acidobacteriaceae bacterium]
MSALSISFVKAHACGNDFLVLEESAVAGQHAALAQRLCARHTGVGADGIEFLQRGEDGSLFLRLFNADGSEAELSGNGTRCVAAWLAANEGRSEMTFQTHGGPRTCNVLEREGGTWWIRTAMGIPRVMPRTIQIAGVDQPIEGAMVNVGNPHFVLFPERADFGSHGMSWEELGAKISVDPLFRFGTNVEFVHVLDSQEIEFRIYERGCGPTQSSGTGTCASSAAAITVRGAARELGATSLGGRQRVVWRENTQEMFLTGPAEIICKGEVEVG